jgi:hypothetical protein
MCFILFRLDAEAAAKNKNSTQKTMNISPDMNSTINNYLYNPNVPPTQSAACIIL